MKCPKCNFENDNKCKFCQQCGTPISDESKSTYNEITESSKKAWYKKWWIWLIIGLGITTLLFVSSCAACTFIVLSQPVSDEISTTLSSSVIEKNITYSIKNMMIEVPQAWSKNEKDDNCYFYDKHGDMLYIHTDNIDEGSFGDFYFESMKEGIKESIDNFSEISSKATLIDDELGYHYIYTCSIDNDDYYMNSYTCAFEDTLYTISFVSNGKKQCSEFNIAEPKIILSISFKPSQSKQSTTAIVSTEKTTEQPTTEKPTEKETELTTEVKKETVIFNNMGITVTYTGVEYHSFKNYVNLRIENNSGHDYTFQLRDVSVNGYMITPVFSCDVKDGKIANDNVTFMQNDFDKNGIKEIENIEFSIHAFNWDDDSHDFDSEMISFNP